MPVRVTAWQNRIDNTDVDQIDFTTADGKQYRVTSKPEGVGHLKTYLDYLKVAERKNLDPFKYVAKNKKHATQLFNFKRLNPPKKPDAPTPPEAEQMDLFGKVAAALDKIANSLEAMHLFTPARRIDELSNALDNSKWCGVDSMGFWDEIANMDIGYERAKKILDAFDAGADTEHSCAKVTKIDAWTCKQVLDLADSMGLIPVINDGHYKEWLEKFGPEGAKKRIKEVYKKLQKKARVEA